MQHERKPELTKKPLSNRVKWIVGVIMFLAIFVPSAIWKYHTYSALQAANSATPGTDSASSTDSGGSTGTNNQYQADSTEIIKWSDDQKPAYQKIASDVSAIEQNATGGECVQLQTDVTSYVATYGATSGAPSSFYNQLLSAENSAMKVVSIGNPDCERQGGLKASADWQAFTSGMKTIFSEAESVGAQPE